MKRMLKLMRCVCVLLLMILPLHAIGEELTQLYLERSGKNDYAAYLAASQEAAAVTEPLMLYDGGEGMPLAEGEQLTFTVAVSPSFNLSNNNFNCGRSLVFPENFSSMTSSQPEENNVDNCSSKEFPLPCFIVLTLAYP